MEPSPLLPPLKHASGEDTLTMPIKATAVGVRVEFGAGTHVGKVRPNNEDQYLVARLCKTLQVLHTSLPGKDASRTQEDHGYLMLVADGMGGHAAGERASAIVVEEVEQFMLRTSKWFFRDTDGDDELRLRDVKAGLEQVHRKILDESWADHSLAGMGTTMTAACSVDADVFIVHVGDSRAYSFHGGQLKQVTRDHTLAQSMSEGGRFPEAATGRMRHVLTNVLGGGAREVRGEIYRLQMADGDRLLLCTDGLYGAVPDTRIAELLGRYPRPDEACQALIAAALAAGGSDNVSVVLAVYTVEA